MKRPRITKRRLLIASGVVLAVYTLGGFVGVPLLARHVILPGLSDQGWLNGTARAESVSCNPFTLRITLTEFELDDVNEEPLVRCGRIVVNASIRTLWEDGYHLDELRLEQPHINLVVTENEEARQREVNLDEMLDFRVLGDKIRALPRVAVDRLAVIEGTASYRDLTLDEPLHQQAEALTFAIEGFDTHPDNLNANRFTGTVGTGGKIAWRGETQLDPLTASGTLDLLDLDLAHYSPYYEGAIEGRVMGGRLTAKLTYEFAPLAEQPVIRAVVEHASLTDISATGRGGLRWHVAADEVATGQITADLIAARIDLQSVTVASPVAIVWAERVAVEATEPEPTDEASAAADPTVEADAEDTPDQSDPAAAEPQDPPVAVAGASEAPPRDTSDGGSIAPEAGEASPVFRLDPPGGWTIVLHQFDVTDADSLLAEQMPEAPLTRAQIAESMPPGLTRLASLQRLGLAEAELGTVPIALTIERVEVDRPAVYVTVDADRKMLLPVIVAHPAAETPTTSAADAQPLPFATIDQLLLNGGRIEARDFSLAQAAELIIADAQGTIAPLTTRDGQDIALDLKAGVGSGKGSVRGTINPFPDTRSADIHLTLDGMALQAVDGYFRRFLGHVLDSGAVAYTGHYTLRGTKIEGSNGIVLNDFHLGEKSDSDDALDLPIKLGISLLRQPNGQVKLDVPVTGDMSDPQFKVGKMIVAAFVNTFGRIATAPFQFLAGSFGSEELDLSMLVFQPGLTTFEQGEPAKLDVMAKALTERPALQLRIVGSTEPAKDTAALRHEALRALIREDRAATLPETDPMRAEPQKITLTEAAYQRGVLLRYAKLAETSAEPLPPVDRDSLPDPEAAKKDERLNVPVLSNIGRGLDRLIKGEAKPDLPVAPDDDPDATDGEGGAATISFAEAEAKLLDGLTLPDDALTGLATERARAVFEALVSREIDPERMTVVPGAEDAEPGTVVRFELQ